MDPDQWVNTSRLSCCLLYASSTEIHRDGEYGVLLFVLSVDVVVPQESLTVSQVPMMGMYVCFLTAEHKYLNVCG